MRLILWANSRLVCSMLLFFFCYAHASGKCFLCCCCCWPILNDIRCSHANASDRRTRYPYRQFVKNLSKTIGNIYPFSFGHSLSHCNHAIIQDFSHFLIHIHIHMVWLHISAYKCMYLVIYATISKSFRANYLCFLFLDKIPLLRKRKSCAQLWNKIKKVQQ